MNPLPVVKTIQSMIGVAGVTEERALSTDELMSKLEIKLPFFLRMVQKYLLRNVRKSIANRERGKSFLILTTHRYRMLYRQLARQMQLEGLLPEIDLIFFLFPSETWQLIETRSPKIVIRAMNRQKNSLRAAKDIYAEHTCGLPIVPASIL